MKEYIYADNAATTKLDPSAFEAMKPYMLDEFGNASQPYSFARQPKKALQKARESIASCIGASPEEIFFTSGGTESDNWAIKGSALCDDNKRATITSAFEHHAILRSCAAIERLGYPVAYLGPSKDGVITPDALESCITDRTRMVSIMFANNEIGSVQPISALSEIAHKHGAVFHTDAVQAVGHLEIDVKNLGIDALSASAQKFNGPKGVGFLYVRRGVKLAPYADGGSQESKYRAGTENVAGIVGMAIALKYNCDNLQDNTKHIRLLEKDLIARLEAAQIKFKRNGGGNTLPGLVSLSFAGKSGEAILHRMDLAGISISTGSACNSKDTDISHVLKAISLEDSLAEGTIRISLGKSNTMEEVKSIAEALVKIVAR